MEQACHKKTYYILTLDPVHVGTGGYRLGRVDNTIVREPGSNLPKIPGSSLCGVARAYAALAIQNENPATIVDDFTIEYERYRNWKYRRPVYSFVRDGENIKVENGRAMVRVGVDGKPLFQDGKEAYHSCAGKGTEDGEGHCGEADCPVCVAFGFSKGKSKSSFQGLAQFFDPRILFFPVHTMVGPVWITSPAVLENAGIRPSAACASAGWLSLNSQLSGMEGGQRNEFFLAASPWLRDNTPQNHLNLGWLYLSGKSGTLNGQPIPAPGDWLASTTDAASMKLGELGIGSQILERLAMISDSLFSRVVNDNLEVRTSVAIDPATGAGEDGALFTYEAIPRATVMWCDIVYNKPEYFDFKVSAGSSTINQPIQHGRDNGQGWTWLSDHIEKGLTLLEQLGIGGMGTRGMGRLRILIKKEAGQ